MTLVWTRVDQKLIHGQICVAWVPHLSIDAIIVVDADMVGDAWAQKVMRLGLPPEVKFAIFSSPSQLPALLAEAEYSNRCLMVIFKDIASALEAVDYGFLPETLNLGNQACQCSEDDIRLADTFYVNADDLEKLGCLQKNGLKVLLQTLPTCKSVLWRAE